VLGKRGSLASWEYSTRVFLAAMYRSSFIGAGRTLIRVKLHHGKIEDAVVRAVIKDDDAIKLQVDVVGFDFTALIDTRQVVE